MTEASFRIEKDSMGEMRAPADVHWGAQTQRALLNFPVSGIRFPRVFIRALGLVKSAAARANVELGLLDGRLGAAIEEAAREIIEGKLDDQFVLDIFQTGSGTSTNMNANEVASSRANVILGGRIGDRAPVHPNDHVNMGQSSNDVIPTCIHVAAVESAEKELLPALRGLQAELDGKAKEFDRIIKIGRTHLQDATPIRLGQEFSGYASMVAHGAGRIENALHNLRELAIGGTAVGTGINTHPRFAGLVIEGVNRATGLLFREAENHFEAQGAKDAAVEMSGALKTVAASLMKICNDVRWLGSGPRCGIGELLVPAVQPGSSIMPGKVNPVIAESLVQVCAQVIGNDAAVTVGGLSGNFELNVMMPVIAHNLLQSIAIMAGGVRIFAEECIAPLRADAEKCRDSIEKSLAMCTSLSPIIGYDRAAKIAKEAHERGMTVREVCIEKNILPEAQLDKALDPWSMTEPGA
jgi:fumarate hydratase class II